MVHTHRLLLPVPSFILLITLLQPACTLFNGNDDHGTDPSFTTNYQKWQKSGLSNYTFVLDRYCFCGGGAYPAKIIVTDKKISQVFATDSQEPVSIDSTQNYADFYPNINGLFNLIQDATERQADQLDVRYDDKYGFPLDIDIDYSKEMVDDEIEYRITSFSNFVQ